MNPVVFIVGMVLLGILLSAIRLYFDIQRQRTLAQVADSLGLTFEAQSQSLNVLPIQDFRLFCYGHGRRIKNLMQGTLRHHGLAIPLAIFDYHYRTSSSRHNQSHSLTVLLLRFRELNLPDFFLRPEGLFDKLGDLFGFQDIDLPDYPEFSRRYVLKGDLPGEIADLFRAGLARFYEQQRRGCTQAIDSHLVYYNLDRLVPPDKISLLVEEGIELSRCLVRNR